MVNIAIIGTGFVGVVHAAVTAQQGHTVRAFDINKEKIDAFRSGDKDKIESYVYENDLTPLIQEQMELGKLIFTKNIKDLQDTDVFFMCLPTPYRDTGESNLDYLWNAGTMLVEMLKQRKEKKFVLFVNKSTVPIGTARRFSEHLKSQGLTSFDVASNPEFLPEGSAVHHAIHPSKVIIGASRPESFSILQNVYSNFTSNPNTVYLETNPETAESIKYASNTLLYSQIVAWQSIPGRIAEAFEEVDFDVLRKGILADPRIARWGSYVSAGAGGSCFKKDDLSLAHQLKKKGVDASFEDILDDINERQKSHLIKRAEIEAKFSFKGKKIAMLGATFKQGTNDIRESNVLAMVPELLKKGAKEIVIYDPLAIDAAKRHFDPKKDASFSRVAFQGKLSAALARADVLIIATDHQEFHSLGDLVLKQKTKPTIILDGRRMLQAEIIKKLVKEGIGYLPVAGRYRAGKR